MFFNKLVSKKRSYHSILHNRSRRHMVKIIGTLFSLIPLKAFPSASDESEITVDHSHQARIPIMLPTMSSEYGVKIFTVVENDLQNSGLFEIIKGPEMTVDKMPDFETIKKQEVHAVVAGHVTSGDKMRVSMRLWDVTTKQHLQGIAYTASDTDWRRVAHLISDSIYQRLIGIRGYFNTRIAYIALTGSRHHSKTQLAIMDQDGANAHMLTDDAWMTLEPRFNPSNTELVYVSYANNQPHVYIYDLQTGEKTLLGSFEGISYAPRFSPDGSSIILTATTEDGGADIYKVNLSDQKHTRLTSGAGIIDTSPCYSPDGKQIVFNSDRGGIPHLYIMSATGENIHRISYGKGHYGSPVWSPDGNFIAFTRLSEGNFSLGIMRPDGSEERMLTQGFTVESPSFSPNGRAIIFCRQSAAGEGGEGFSSSLCIIDISGENERILPTTTGAKDPAWSFFSSDS